MTPLSAGGDRERADAFTKLLETLGAARAARPAAAAAASAAPRLSRRRRYGGEARRARVARGHLQLQLLASPRQALPAIDDLDACVRELCPPGTDGAPALPPRRRRREQRRARGAAVVNADQVGSAEAGDEKPAVVEVVVDLLLSLLAHSSHSAAFRDVAK